MLANVLPGFGPVRALRQGSYVPVDLNNAAIHPLWRVEETRVADARSKDLREGAAPYLLWRFRKVESGIFAGHILVRVDGGSIDRAGTPQLVTGTVPWAALETAEHSPYPWVDQLARFDAPAWFTMHGADTWSVFERPVRMPNGLLAFRFHRRLV